MWTHWQQADDPRRCAAPPGWRAPLWSLDPSARWPTGRHPQLLEAENQVSPAWSGGSGRAPRKNVFSTALGPHTISFSRTASAYGWGWTRGPGAGWRSSCSLERPQARRSRSLHKGSRPGTFIQQQLERFDGNPARTAVADASARVCVVGKCMRRGRASRSAGSGGGTGQPIEARCRFWSVVASTHRTGLDVRRPGNTTSCQVLGKPTRFGGQAQRTIHRTAGRSSPAPPRCVLVPIHVAAAAISHCCTPNARIGCLDMASAPQGCGAADPSGDHEVSWIVAWLLQPQ